MILFIFPNEQSPGQQLETKTGIPPFTILLTNGSHFGYKDLQKDNSVLLIYFSPDCDHCKEYIKKMIPRMNDLKNIQIIMISYYPIINLQKFYIDFKLGQFKNVKVGTEGNSFLVPGYFKISTFPFTAFYNRAGKLMAIFRKPPSMDDLTKLSKKS